MLVAAPGRFSITNDCPVRSDSHCPISRAVTSVEPPGAKPTTSRTGRAGYACACARAGRMRAATSAVLATRKLLRFIQLLLQLSRPSRLLRPPLPLQGERVGV